MESVYHSINETFIPMEVNIRVRLSCKHIKITFRYFAQLMYAYIFVQNYLISIARLPKKNLYLIKYDILSRNQ